MARILRDQRTDGDPVAAAAEVLATTGVALMPSSDVTRSLGVGREAWTRFARHWWHLPPDPCAAELGVQRSGRYGQYLVLGGVAYRLPARTSGRPQEPLTDGFVDDPLLHNVIELLARMAAALDDVAEWNVKVHPFRIRSSAAHGNDKRRPKPESPHRDDVTLVSSLLIRRRNVTGGESLVCDLTGRRLLTASLAEPGTLLLSDDRRTLHGVSPIRPVNGSRPAQRDVLEITFASAWP
jgi:hypothetical protein